jgi:hypothetical protein
MTLTARSTREILHAFVEATQLGDIDAITNLLDDSGAFEYQDEHCETHTGNKQEFTNWYSQRLKATAISSVDYDQCLHCVIGGSVVLFNEGTFPRMPLEFFERSKAGLRISCKDGLICGIHFCFVFLKTDNDKVADDSYEKRKIKNAVKDNESLNL